MEWAVVIAIVAIVFTVVRVRAARRVQRREGQYVWLVFLPTLLGPIVLLLVGMSISDTAPVLGVLLAAFGFVSLAIVVRFLSRASHAVSTARPGEDVGTAVTEPMADYMLAHAGLMLIGVLVVAIGLVVWAIATGGH